MLNYRSAPELSSRYLETVWENLPGHVRSTLFLSAPALSVRLGCTLTIASETFQYTGSFKFRAAYNLLSSIEQGYVVAASSGNFGQAVAYASQILHKSATIVMPSTSARFKIAAVEGYGGTFCNIEIVVGNGIRKAQSEVGQIYDLKHPRCAWANIIIS